LAGHVNSFTEKWHAEQVAQRVAGVKGLAVEMDVRLPGLSERTDADIARSAENVLAWTTGVPNEAIKVKVEDGWLTLSGKVEWDFQRQTAANAVRHLMGVVGVSEEIALKPKASTNGVKAEIEAALKRRAQIDALRIQVEVQGGEVTLTGTVHSWAERQLAASTAWGAVGVRQVIDNITIAF
jgi:osmotically-inducible protein OsmY